MTDTATLQRQLDALKQAYRSGVLTCSYDGKSTTYRSGAELRAAIASIENELGITSTQPKAVVVRSHKGW